MLVCLFAWSDQAGFVDLFDRWCLWRTRRSRSKLSYSLSTDRVRAASVRTVPGGIPCRAGYRAVRDTVPCGIPCRAGYRAVRAHRALPPAPAACRAACCRAPRSACSRNRAPPAVHTRHGIPRQGDRRSERPSKRREEKRREETRNGAQRERPNRNQMQMEPEGGSRACPSFDSSHAFPSKGESCTLPHLQRNSAWRLPRPADYWLCGFPARQCRCGCAELQAARSEQVRARPRR